VIGHDDASTKSDTEFSMTEASNATRDRIRGTDRCRLFSSAHDLPWLGPT